MRYLFGFMCVLALGLMGCSETSGTCSGTVCSCTEEGIRTAIAVGGGPYTFACNGPTTVETQAEIVIDNDVILNGEGNLTVHGPLWHRVLSVAKGVTAELQRLGVTHGTSSGGGIVNEGTLTIRDCVISGNVTEGVNEPEGPHEGSIPFSRGGAGIFNGGQMTVIASTVSENDARDGHGGGMYNDRSASLMLIGSTVSDNRAGFDGSGPAGGGIYNIGEMTMLNSTVSGNRASCFDRCVGQDIANVGKMRILNSTVSSNSPDAIGTYSNPRAPDVPYFEMANTLIDGDCDEFLYEVWAAEGDALEPQATWVSNGHNIESPGDTCGFDQPTDQVDVAAADLNLGPLADNGGPTLTHEPGDGGFGEGSVAIDVIPEAACLDADGQPLMTDQRGEARPGGTMCDVGAFEVQP